MTKAQGGFSSRGHLETENRQMKNETTLPTMLVPSSKALSEVKKEKNLAGTEFKPQKD